MAKAENDIKLPKPKIISEFGLTLDCRNTDGLLSKPELSSMIMAYIGHISELDFKLECATLVAIGGGQKTAEAFLAGMTALEYSHRRSAVSGVLARKSGLPQKQIEDLFVKIGKVRSLRNDFAHGMWFTHEEIPNALILSKTYNELLRFGIGLDAMHIQPIRSRIQEILTNGIFETDRLSNKIREDLFDLLYKIESPWDRAFSNAANNAARAEAAARENWFKSNPGKNIDWSQVLEPNKAAPLERSHLLAIGGGVHESAQVWDAVALNQALQSVIDAKQKAQHLLDKIIEIDFQEASKQFSAENP